LCGHNKKLKEVIKHEEHVNEEHIEKALGEESSQEITLEYQVLINPFFEDLSYVMMDFSIIL